MILNVTIDLSDVWADYDGENLGDILSNEMKHSITQEIKKLLPKEVFEDLRSEVIKEVKKHGEKLVKDRMRELIDTNSIKFDNTHKSLDDWISYEFQRGHGWRNPEAEITKRAKQHAQEMQNRYDLMFATSLVSKMQEQGLLKEGVYKSLMSNNENK